eukprot:CAMPEP_0202870822 /NCGR_PEP_ID=MMETSP1391-20130828/16869_1 /ASSEMBLY_ACC=CAM_ASM_000867 /TAXON_ID=1034604 /ORGANISM="Chlamydomonas leiostraca, Strain SAG 11-49" /LENGTH=77 /DNA_ID=CAMNT_0049551471 /DNA_START=153 /DNA_END=382 /DNA_ORIENTATION=-
MAATYTGRTSAPAPPAGTCTPGVGERSCAVIKNAVPGVHQPGEDYAGRPRMVTSSKGIVASDQSRCSDIGAAVLDEG